MASTPAAYQPRTPLRPQPAASAPAATGGTGVEPRAHTQFGLTLPQAGDDAVTALRAALEAVKDFAGVVHRHAEGAAAFLTGPLLDGHEKAATEAHAVAGDADDLIASLTHMVESVREATANEATQMQPTYDAADGSAAFLAPVPTVGQLREH